MTDTSVDDLSWAELPSFDPRALRKAIRRGVIRTGFVGAVWLLVALFFLNIVGALLLGAFGRTSDLQDNARIAWQVAHPEYSLQGSGVNHGIWNASMFMDVVPLSSTGSNSRMQFTITESMLGTVGVHGLTVASPASGVLNSLGQFPGSLAADRSQDKADLTGLPPSTSVSAIIEFAKPLDSNAYQAFSDAHNDDATHHDGVSLFGSIPLFSSALDTDSPRHGVFVRGVYGWNPAWSHKLSGSYNPIAEAVPTFRKWVHSIGSDGDKWANLGIDLPSLRAAADEGRVYGLIVTGAAPSALLKLLDDPEVGAVHLYDVGFRTEADNSSYFSTS